MTTKRWIGNAASLSDLWTVSLSGTVVSQTYSMTINNKSISYASTGGDTVATIFASLVTLWNQTTPANPPEFGELTAAPVPATGSATSMTLTGNLPGRPSTISVSTSGAATFTIANTTPATGPNDFTNAANWSTNSAPANSDTLVFDNGSVDCKYGLNSSLTGVTLLIQQAYSGKIGLPFINADAATTYNEYRATSLTLAGGTATINAGSIQRCNLAFGANTATIRVLNTGSRIDKYTPVVLIQGGNGSSSLNVSKGDVGVAFYQGQTATLPTLNTGFVSNPAADVTLFCGVGATLTTLVKNGGTAELHCSATTVVQDIAGGTLTLADAAAVTALNAYGGTVSLNTTGTVGTINLYGSALLTADGDPRAKTITNPINVYSSNVAVVDNQKVINASTLSIAGNGSTSVNVQHGSVTTAVFT